MEKKIAVEVPFGARIPVPTKPAAVASTKKVNWVAIVENPFLHPKAPVLTNLAVLELIRAALAKTAAKIALGLRVLVLIRAAAVTRMGKPIEIAASPALVHLVRTKIVAVVMARQQKLILSKSITAAQTMAVTMIVRPMIVATIEVNLTNTSWHLRI